MNDFKPSDFANLGQPMCSRAWGKSELEWIALAYVQALAADGDTWKPLTKAQTMALLTDEQRRHTHGLLKDDFYDGWFQSVRDRITDSDGALSVGGFWNEFRLGQGKSGD